MANLLHNLQATTKQFDSWQKEILKTYCTESTVLWWGGILSKYHTPEDIYELYLYSFVLILENLVQASALEPLCTKYQNESSTVYQLKFKTAQNEESDLRSLRRTYCTLYFQFQTDSKSKDIVPILQYFSELNLANWFSKWQQKLEKRYDNLQKLIVFSTSNETV